MKSLKNPTYRYRQESRPPQGGFSSAKTTEPESFALQRRIGSTTFKVNVHFNKASKETLEEKVLRLMKNDLNFTHKNGNMKPLQAGWLSERGSL